MLRRLGFAALLFLGLIASSQTASACDVCRYGGFICDANGCELVEVCRTPSYPKRGFSDCYFVAGVCNTGGQSCVWALLINPVQPEQPQDEKAS
jgi:hypothetical protein